VASSASSLRVDDIVLDPDGAECRVYEVDEGPEGQYVWLRRTQGTDAGLRLFPALDVTPA
jgi:hypothetical protein